MPYEDKKGRPCGFLNVEQSNKQLSRRYFVLDNFVGKLKLFYDSPLNLPKSSRDPYEEIDLRYVSKVRDGRKQRPKLGFCLIITHAGEDMYLQADAENEMLQWIEFLNNACKITVPNKSSTLPSRVPEQITDDVHRTGTYRTEIVGDGIVLKCAPEQDKSDSDDSSEDERHHKYLGPAIKAGFATKQGAMRKNWKRRYFVLTEHGLSYYKSELDKSPIKTIEKEDIVESRLVHGQHHPHRQHLLEVETPKRTFFIQCDTPEDSQSWVDTINGLVKGTQQLSVETKTEPVQPAGLKTRDDSSEEIKPSKAVWV